MRYANLREEMRKKAFIVSFVLFFPGLAFAAELGETVQTDVPDKPGFILLTAQHGCQTGPTDRNGSRSSCSVSVTIHAPDGFQILGRTIDSTQLANKGTGAGCRPPRTALGYNNEGDPVLKSVSVAMNARSEKGGALRDLLPTDIDALVKRGLIGPASALLSNLETKGAVVCKLTVSAKRI